MGEDAEKGCTGDSGEEAGVGHGGAKISDGEGLQRCEEED